jgi:hypothetical protein
MRAACGAVDASHRHQQSLFWCRPSVFISVPDASWRRREMPQAIGCSGENRPGNAPNGLDRPLMPYPHPCRDTFHDTTPTKGVLFYCSPPQLHVVTELVAVRAGPTLHVTGHAKSLSIQSTLALGLCVCCYPFRLHEYVTGLLIPHLRAYPRLTLSPASPSTYS